MATRRRIGISAATTEAARRQLMQPVPCWEKDWVVPANAAAGSKLKVYKWVKTEKSQQFSDDEGEADEPLAPLPDEPEVVEGDEEMDQEDQAASVAPDATQREATAIQDDLSSKPPSPKPQLSMSSALSVDQPGDGLDASLKPLDTDMDVGIGEKSSLGELDMTALGPDGLGLESSHDLSQMAPPDVLIGGSMMDQTSDPFAEPGT